jgi:hypothetical protein
MGLTVKVWIPSGAMPVMEAAPKVKPDGLAPVRAAASGPVGLFPVLVTVTVRAVILH